MQSRQLYILVFARIYVGFLWLAYGTSKFEQAWAAPKGEFFKTVRSIATQNHGPAHAFIVGVVLPNISVFARLIAYGETLVGISLLLGLFKNAGAIGGLFLSLTYYLVLEDYGFRLGFETLEGLLFVFCLLLLLLREAPRRFSLDLLLSRYAPLRRRNRLYKGGG